MIPSILAKQLKIGLTDYVDTTFPITTPLFEGSIRRFLERDDAFFHAPYLSVKLPFRVAEHGNERFTALHPKFAPYVHQNISYDRLCGEDGRSTLVATGTGSGKTECFLYPILEYCYNHRSERGIKALIIYPMNALAADQARRIAELIDASPELHGNVTAGMYVGGLEAHAGKTMQKERIITDRDTLVQTPPDILLTNYKMLDYLLVRPKDAQLWEKNTPETLKYIVVDELHTFDGAQGTDLACLLRRLKSRLTIQPGYLCCVGTSATMGGKESVQEMVHYAETVFGEPFEKDAIVTENRLTTKEFFNSQTLSHFRIPAREEADRLQALAEEENKEAYLQAAMEAWFEESERITDLFDGSGCVRLAEQLMHHSFFQSMLAVMENGYVQPKYLIERLSSMFMQLNRVNASAVIDSMTALISHARILVAQTLRPFLQVQVQLWMRELRRMLAKVDPKSVEFALESDLNQIKAEKQGTYLPVVNCRECGATGWAGLIDEQQRLNITDLNVFYNQYFSFDKRVRAVFPKVEGEENIHLHQGIQLCPYCMNIQMEHNGSTKCAVCGKDTIPAWMPNLETDKERGAQKRYVCPFCESAHGFSLVGLQSATAISAGVSQLYASHFNDDKKLLAFSDNVQDAAHRAGFFNARTWRFGIRTAIQHFADDGGMGLALTDFPDACAAYWREKMSGEDFVDTFIAHNMADDRAYETLLKEGKFPSAKSGNALINSVEARFRYEIVLEYGLNSRIGRTLEKSGVSVLAFQMHDIESLLQKIIERADNEAGVKGLSSAQVACIISGWVYHMRQNGAFNLSVYNAYIQSGARGYLLSHRFKNWMPGLFVTPKFMTTKQVNDISKGFEVMTERAWYLRNLSHAIGKTPLECPGIFQLAGILIEEMRNRGILEQIPGPGGLPVFALKTDAFRVSGTVCRYRCKRCGHTVCVANEDTAYWGGAHCQRNECTGVYAPADSAVDYFGKLYKRGELQRIHAHEHTGLLERDNREKLETDFKHPANQHKRWDPNLLSCTPTLEMGIDIGDLSSVVLCSIPPAQAQYLQRVGRAGRKDGNALTLAVATAKPHDLYFYADPLEMISGNVQAPGVFLDASAVLERQFVAFCFDCWVKSGIQENAIPRKVGAYLGKIKASPEPRDVFPFNFLNYIRANLSRLNRTFVQMFGGQLSDESIKRIHAFSYGEGLEEDSLESKIKDAFVNLFDQRETLTKDIQKLKRAIDELRARPQDASFDAEIKDLDIERNGLIHLKQVISEKDTFNFLSDEGLLPNYAFPEAGIVLKAVLTRKVEEDDAAGRDNRYERTIYEYSRSASSAISELAPDNNFYAEGRRLKIDQIDVKSAEPEKWRLCPNCAHAAPESSLHNIAFCPVCASAAWADQGQVRTMLKVRMVYSNMRYDETRSGDESDERNTKFYTKQMLVDVDENNEVKHGYKMDNGEFPFGYDFVRKATLREINFGESENAGTKLMVAGKEDVRNGFVLCKYCGKIQHGNEPLHTHICKAYKRNLADPFEECMFLYREFISEAIRVLIPATDLQLTQVKQESFIAAIMLGLKKYFGSVDHLRACVTEFPVPDAEYRKQYLVIYDSVPGGTGYLKQLMTGPEEMMRVLELALKTIETCTCANNSTKDGCYHCLYAYRQSSKMNNISRKEAARMLRSILQGKGTLELVPGIGSIPVNKLFDSELEKRFIEALNKSGSNNRKVEIHKLPVNGKEGYILQIGMCIWEVELQVPMGGEDGISVNSKADFVFRPKHLGFKQKSVVVFTDGFTFHKQITDADTLKRAAIRRSEKYRLWSITWRDVINFTSKQQTAYVYEGILDHKKMPSKSMFDAVLLKTMVKKLDLNNMSGFDTLVAYLADNDAEDTFRAYANAYSLATLEPNKLQDQAAFDQWQACSVLVSDASPFDNAGFGNTAFGTWQAASIPQVVLYSGISVDKLKKNELRDGGILLILDDSDPEKTDAFEKAWGAFLKADNLLQFQGKYLSVTQKGMDSSVYDILSCKKTGDETDITVSQENTSEDWEGIIEELFDAVSRNVAEQLKQKGAPAPVVGFELINAAGAVAAMAEMAWVEQKIAWLAQEQMEDRPVFETAGWTVCLWNDPKILDMFEEVET